MVVPQDQHALYVGSSRCTVLLAVETETVRQIRGCCAAMFLSGVALETVLVKHLVITSVSCFAPLAVDDALQLQSFTTGTAVISVPSFWAAYIVYMCLPAWQPFHSSSGPV